VLTVVLAASLVACGSGSGAADATAGAGTAPSSAPPPTVAAATTTALPTTAPPATPSAAPSGPAPTATPPAAGISSATPAPAWMGRRALKLRPDGYGAMGPTPAELDPRNIATVDELPPPADGAFHSKVSAVPASVVARSTWSVGCPVALADLRYVTVTFLGFDGRPHTGELLVHRTAAAPMVRIFRKLYAARFPVERMVVTTVEERDVPPTGDGNTTGAFNCRSSAGSTAWSRHAYGLAVDVNPFMNPYVKGGITLPELATTYRDRGDVRPGMLTRGSVAVAAFQAEGWVWGGTWRSLKDFMHFSPSGT
jgi:hypothetical protein